MSRWLLPTILALAASIGSPTPAQENPEPTYTLVSPRPTGIIATDINARGDVIGFEWVDDPEFPGVLTQAPFLARGTKMTYLPLLEGGYTATFPSGVGDDGTVVGRSSKPAREGVVIPMLNQGFVWNEATGMRGLGVLEGDSTSFASGISQDGRRISGYSVGRNRVRACVWERGADGETWTGTPLPHEADLGANVVPLSDDGRHAASVDGVEPCLWSRQEDGIWTRAVLGESGSMIPRAVNNNGMVVGVRFVGDGTTQAVAWTRDRGLFTLEKPPGYVRAEATALNNADVVVGWVDGPPGSDLGPNPFVYEHATGRLRLLTEAGPTFSTATAINDNNQVAGVVELIEEEPGRLTELSSK